MGSRQRFGDETNNMMVQPPSGKCDACDTALLQASCPPPLPPEVEPPPLLEVSHEASLRAPNAADSLPRLDRKLLETLHVPDAAHSHTVSSVDTSIRSQSGCEQEYRYESHRVDDNLSDHPGR